MKYLKLILLVTCLIQVKTVKSQGNNLQFNQAIYTNINYSPSNQYTTTQNLTVPTNKVWKIESAAAGSNNVNSNGVLIPGGTISVNDIVIFSSPNPVLPNLPNLSNLPLWLPSGNYTLSISTDGGYTGVWKGFISGIEYNVVP
jgi:hypothetical protein